MSKIQILILSLFLALNCHAQFSNQAKWISSPTNNSTENQWLIFRKNYTVAEPLTEKLVAKISVDSKYRLIINGELVVFEGQFKRDQHLSR